MDRLTRIAARTIAWAVFFGLVLMLFGNPIYQVQNGYVGVETCFGKVVGKSLQPGMDVKRPWCRVIQVDTRARTLNDVNIDAPSFDLQELKGTATIQYRIQPAAAGEVYSTFGLEKEIEDVVLTPGLQEVAKSVTAKYSGTDLFYKRDLAQQEMTDALAKWADDAAKARGLEHVIEVYGVQLTGSHFSQVFEDALNNKAIRAQDLPRADKERDTQVTDAKAEAAKRVRTAEANANQIRWNAEAEANGMQAKMQQLKEHPELPCYMAYKKWDGKLSDVTSGQTMPFAEACASVK